MKDCQNLINYFVETTILEKRLVHDKSLLLGNAVIYHLNDLKSCYNQQLVNARELIKELV